MRSMEEILREFIYSCAKQYGPKNTPVSITLPNSLYRVLEFEVSYKARYTSDEYIEDRTEIRYYHASGFITILREDKPDIYLDRKLYEIHEGRLDVCL